MVGNDSPGSRPFGFIPGALAPGQLVLGVAAVPRWRDDRPGERRQTFVQPGQALEMRRLLRELSRYLKTQVEFCQDVLYFLKRGSCIKDSLNQASLIIRR